MTFTVHFYHFWRFPDIADFLLKNLHFRTLDQTFPTRSRLADYDTIVNYREACVCIVNSVDSRRQNE